MLSSSSTLPSPSLRDHLNQSYPKFEFNVLDSTLPFNVLLDRTTETQNHLLRLRLTYIFHSIVALIGSGSAANFVSSSLSARLNNPLVDCPTYEVGLADGSTVSDHRCGVLKLEPLPGSQVFLQSPIKYDCVLCMPFLRSYNPRIDWTTGEVRLKDDVLECFNLSISVPNRIFNRTVKTKGLESFLIHALPVKEEQKFNADEFIQEFPQVFSDSGSGSLPPSRPGFDHRIDLLPETAPIALRPYRISPMEESELRDQIGQLLRD